jgi:pantoate--beta-alanine ligase
VKVVRTIEELRHSLAPGRVGLVPTMGSLHEGHTSLFRTARIECEVVVASLFVNPAQFGSREDFDTYPRDEAHDARVAADADVDILFAPPQEVVYPPGYQTWVEVERLGSLLEGAHRPGHFRGVATVCLKLFNIVRPDRAYFGQKDAQQAALLRQLVRDLDLELELRVLPTVRESDGLALSSRNAYLSTDERQRALALPRALARGRDAFSTGSDPVAAARAELNGLLPDYVGVIEVGDARLLVAAARIGPVRLIDNVLLEGELQ